MAGAKYLLSGIRDENVRARLLKTFAEVYGKRDAEKLRREAEENGYEMVELPSADSPIHESDDESELDARRDKHGRTAAVIAAMSGNDRFLRSLKGSSLNLPDNQGRTALMWAVLNGHHHIVATIAKDISGVDFDQRDGEGKTAAIMAAEANRPDLFLLLQSNADLKLPDKDGNTPLIRAARNGHDGFIREVRDIRNLDFNDINHQGQTAAIIAARYRHADVLQAMNGKADFNIQDPDGNTPAIIAAQNGDMDSLLAVRDRTDFSLKNRHDKKTAVDYARERGYLDIVRAIEERPVRYTRIHSTAERILRWRP